MQFERKIEEIMFAKWGKPKKNTLKENFEEAERLKVLAI